MKLLLTTLLAATVALFVFSCNESAIRENRKAAKTEAAPKYTSTLNKAPSSGLAGSYSVVTKDEVEGNGKKEEANNGFISSSAAVENDKDTTHRFIRTTEMKFRVKNVLNSALAIEDIAHRFNGFVINTNLNSTIDNTAITAVSADSSLESTYYTVNNTITLRVPNTKLDSTLRTIAICIDYLDYRRINAEDVAPQLLADRLTQKRIAENRKRVIRNIKPIRDTINVSGTATLKESYRYNWSYGDVNDVEQSLVDKQEDADKTMLNTLSLKDRIKYSTVSLELYQRQAVKRTVIANDKNISVYKPSMGAQLLEAIKTGLEVLEEILLVLIRMWPLILLLAVGIVVYRKFLIK